MMFEDSLAAQLRAQGYRLTPQRLAILRTLRETGEHLTPAQVYQRVKQELPGLTEATVYRSLDFLTRQGLAFGSYVDRVGLVYEIAKRDHHHLICRACGQTREIGHTLLQKLYKQILASTAYQIDTKHLMLYGLCPDCQNDSTAESQTRR